MWLPFPLEWSRRNVQRPLPWHETLSMVRDWAGRICRGLGRYRRRADSNCDTAHTDARVDSHCAVNRCVPGCRRSPRVGTRIGDRLLVVKRFALVSSY